MNTYKFATATNYLLMDYHDIADRNEENGISQFVNQSIQKIQEYVMENSIETVYLPVDGTRRYFIQERGIDYRDPNFFPQYFDFSITKMVNLLKMTADTGISNIVVLLMDHTAFSRDTEYLKNAIRMGIDPLIADKRFLDFYESHSISPYFGGFNHIYRDRGFEETYDKMLQTNEQSLDQQNFQNVIYYTGPPHELGLIDLVDSTTPTDPEGMRKQLLDRLYPIEISPISFAMYFGYPRDKVKPVLLSGSSTNFYTSNPSLSITRHQLNRAIYLTGKVTDSIKDSYKKYGKDTEYEIDTEQERSKLIGENSYLNN